MRTRIISAFPGTGKTHFTQNNTTYKCLDSDSSHFSWTHAVPAVNVLSPDSWGKPVKVETKTRHPDWPNNYIKHIQENIGEYDFIFVSTHKEVRQALLDNCLFFYLIYPCPYKAEEYLQRYRDRGNDNAFVSLLNKNWDAWLKELTFCGVGCKQIEMVFPYLEKELNHIVCSENGER